MFILKLFFIRIQYLNIPQFIFLIAFQYILIKTPKLLSINGICRKKTKKIPIVKPQVQQIKKYYQNIS